MLFDAFVLAAGAEYQLLHRLKEVVREDGHTMCATIRDDSLEPIHLPDIPRDNIGNILNGFVEGTLTELLLIILDKGD